MAKTAGRVAYADALRALAIFTVVMFHIIAGDSLSFHGKAHTFGYFGIWGVDCFFVLSGFLLGAPFLRAIIEGRAMPSTRLYAARRFFRIYPLYLIVLLAIVVDLILARKPPAIWDVLAHLTMTHAFFGSYFQSISGPLWTMAVDTQFYIVLPIAAFLTVRALGARTRERRVAAIRNILICLAASSLVFRFVCAYIMSATTSVGDPAYTALYVAGLHDLPGTGIDFVIGCGLALLTITSPVPTRSQPWYAACAIVGALLLFGVARAQELSAHHSIWSQAFGFAMQDAVGGLSAGLILYGTIRGDFPWLRRAVSARSVALVSALAYAVYLVHLPIVNHIAPLISAHHGTVRGMLELLAATIPPVLVVAYVLHRFVEKPFLTIRDRQREAPTPIGLGQEIA